MRKRIEMKVFSFFWLFGFCSASFATDQFVLWDQNFEQGNSAQIIELIGEATVAEFGPYTMTRSIPLEQGRAIEELERGRTLNMAVMGNDSLREQRIVPIYVPIDKGELGLRICLINKGEQDLFSDLTSAQSARRADLVFGLGSYWPDTPIYARNGFNVYSTPVFENLFRALKKQRFDCMSRSISEITGDHQKHASYEFDIEKKLAFVYPLANFIYVSDSSQLHKRIETGLKRLIDSGKLEQLNNQFLQQHLKELNFFGRKLIILENPNLTEAARKAINQYGLISFENASR